MLSPEDVAWADSCLNKDPDMIDSGWVSLKNALFEAFDTRNDPSPFGREDSLERDSMDFVLDGNRVNDLENVEEKYAGYIDAAGEGGDSSQNIQIQSSHNGTDDTPLLKKPISEEIHSTEGSDHVHNSETTPISIADTSGGAEENNDGILNQEDAFWSKHKKEDIFLPTYDESLKDLGLSEEVDFVFEEFELQQPTEDIFKIWDFDIPPEENDLIKQLQKALAGNPPEPAAPPFSDDSEAWKGLQDSSVDGLISGIADLTLNPHSDLDEST